MTLLHHNPAVYAYVSMNVYMFCVYVYAHVRIQMRMCVYVKVCDNVHIYARILIPVHPLLITNYHPKVIWIILNLPEYTKLALIPHIVLPQRVYTAPPRKKKLYIRQSFMDGSISLSLHIYDGAQVFRILQTPFSMFIVRNWISII